MNVLLIFPRIEHGASTYMDKDSWTSILFGYPIITLPHIAAITPKKHNIRIVNENYEDIDFDEDVDLIGITCYTMTAPRVYEIADEFRSRDKKVVLGGYHPTAIPDESKQHADSIVLGEAETPDYKTYIRTYNWNFGNKYWKISYETPINTYMNYFDSNVSRIPQNQPYPKDKMAAFVTSDEKVIKDLADELDSRAESQNYNDITTANFVLKFVQSNIIYRLDDDTKNCQEYWRFPVETLVDKQGDCEDTSVLYAALMDTLDYDMALLFYSWVEDGEKLGHLAVGIQLNGNHGSYVEDKFGTRYYYCETTTTVYTIGQIPKDIRTEPKMIIPIWD